MFNTVLHTARFFLRLDSPHSQTTQAERDCLKKYASGRTTACEIGVYEGLTTRLIAEAMDDDGLLFAIDPFFSGRVGICWSELIAHGYTSRSNSSANIKFLKKMSFDAVDDVPDNLDFVFVDGDHSLKGITRDWEDWSTRVVVGGLIALHDTKVPSHNQNVQSLGSFKYFESHIRHDARFELIEQIDSLSVLKRK